jgi:hypothetical protein
LLQPTIPIEHSDNDTANANNVRIGSPFC